METQLGLDDTVVALDQAIYVKALEVVWKHKEEFKTIVLLMGSFHVTCVFLSVIGKRLRDNGLRDICSSSHRWTVVHSMASMASIHNRALRTHKFTTIFLLVILSFLLLVTFACDTTYLIIMSLPTLTVVHD